MKREIRRVVAAVVRVPLAIVLIALLPFWLLQELAEEANYQLKRWEAGEEPIR